MQPQAKEQILQIIDDVRDLKTFSHKRYRKILGRHPKKDGLYSKEEVLKVYRQWCDDQGREPEQKILSRIQVKPIRTISGVVPVTVLTKPFPCPGKCIFCPTDVRMPKSYLHDEPGAMRAESASFDPYRQVSIRMRAFYENGHSTDKIELLILGGTWSSYPLKYRMWFVKRCFDAMNGINENDSGEDAITWRDIERVHQENENAQHRCIGLSVETRPDWITPEELITIRRLGGTKVQVGIQSMDDSINDLNKRGHSVDETRKAFTLLRQAGFKIHGHWMANLYGANVETDKRDFEKVFTDEGIKPDELKIYPTILVKNAELYQYWKRGEYTPYSRSELSEVVLHALPRVPRYTRINRLFRDFPSPNIVAGEKHINFRQIIEQEAEKRGIKNENIRRREIGVEEVDKSIQPVEEILEYSTQGSREIFMSFNTNDDKLLGFLRLSLPKKEFVKTHFMEELRDCAIIREVHVYGPAQKISKKGRKAQHKGFGTRLIERAVEIAKEEGYTKLAVISSIGTREYYKKRGFNLVDLYQVKSL